MKRKTPILFVLLLALMLCFSLAACGGKDTVATITNDSGIVADGEFEKGSTLVTTEISETNSAWQDVLSAIAEQDYDKESDVYIYDISVEKDGKKVQPNGKVKITIPAPTESVSDFTVFHIKDDSTVEKLASVYANGKITFETSSFSYFVVTAKSSEVDSQKVTALTLDAHNAGFAYEENGELAERTVVKIGAEYTPNAEYVLVSGVTAEGNKSLTKGEDYTIDLGGLDYTKEGTYTITYTYKKDTSIKATLKVEVVDSQKVTALTLDAHNAGFAYEENGELAERTVVKIGAEYTPNAEYVLVSGVTAEGNKSLTKDEDYTIDLGGLDFNVVGVYTITYTYKKDTSIKATLKVEVVDSQKVTALTLDAHNAGFAYEENGELAERTVVKIGAEYTPNAEYVLVSGVTAEGNKSLTKDEDYTIDLGGLDFNVVGVYTITYTYKKDTSIKATLKVEVVEAEELTFVFSNSQAADSREHEYNGAAVFVSKKDIMIGGTPLSEITDENVLSKISYVWRNKNTGATVTPDKDITLTGEVNTQYGVNRDITIGYEIAGPCIIGEYEFVLSYNGIEKLIVEATITERSFQKITSVSDFDATTAPTIFGEICYYTIVGYANGKTYVMQMPADDSSAITDIVEAQARLVAEKEDGSLVLGEKFDFVFTPMRYFSNESKYYPDTSSDREDLLVDFCTGYYGARTATIGLATQVINRIGWTSLSGNKIARYKEEISAYDTTYGNLTKFSADGSVKIYAPRKGETENNALRLVKDGDKFYFTGKDSTTDTRPSYPVYIYKYYVPEEEQTGTYEFYNKLSKTYDGNAVQFNAYKDVNIQTEDGYDVGSLLKMGTGRFVFTDLKGNEVLVGNVQDDGTVTGPSAVGQYQLVFQIQEKGDNGPIWVEKAVLHTFEITEASGN